MTSPGGPTSTPGPPLPFDKIHHPSVRGAGPGRGGDFADKQEGSGGAARPPGKVIFIFVFFSQIVVLLQYVFVHLWVATTWRRVRSLAPAS